MSLLPSPPALVVFDLDGTLLRGPTVCEVLAEPLGRSARMRELERFRSRRELLAAREEMAGWYRQVPRAELLRSLEGTRRAPGLAAGIAVLRAAGAELAIASITWRFAVERFAVELGIAHCLGTELDEASGAIRHVWPEDKARWVLELASRLEVPLERTVAVGDSAGDHDMLGVVGTAVYVGASPPPHTSWWHLPDADISDLAERLVGEPALGPRP